MQTLIIHGRQPALGIAELESLYGSEKLSPIGNEATILDIDPAEINFSRLGGMVKFCKILTVLDTTNWLDIEKFLLDAVPAHAKNLDKGKLKFGLSTYGLKVNSKELMATGKRLKKSLAETGRSSRFIPNSTNSLNSAQVLYNKLTQKLGWELVFVRNGNKTILAQSIAVQDIDKYAARDQARPYRDSKVGMLPPKLAQIIINLSGARTAGILWDPFCGTGVLLQEALLIGIDAFGSDIEPRMVEYSKKNLDWLIQAGETICPGGVKPSKNYSLEVADAIDYKFKADVIACETFLGRPLSSLPDNQTLQKIMADCDTIHEKFLKNIASQTKPDFRMCLAVPAWKIRNGFKHLKTLDKLAQLGYNRVKFVHAKQDDLIYHRQDQIVARELVVLVRK